MVSIYDELKALSDENYKKFQTGLVPNISPDTVIGVRTPDMRKIADSLFKSGDYEEFLESLPHKWYEENLVHFFIIGLIKDFDECVRRVEAFLPFVDCWPVSDQSSPKVFKKYHDRLLPYIEKWTASPHVYTSRFGIRMYMNEFLGGDFKEEYLEFISKRCARGVKEYSSGKTRNGYSVPEEAGDDYYHRMMVAWYFATALAKKYDAAVKYMETGNAEGKNGKDTKTGGITPLDEWTRRKSIQKAVESFRVSEEHKAYLKSLR
ncbi:MAG: DNA alkylation repair protein [Lachnospiraceae bacterium]|nr:DNA alkylation repair protein [Lachnospiraceae bacterium]